MCSCVVVTVKITGALKSGTSSSAIGPKTGTAMSAPSVRLQYGSYPWPYQRNAFSGIGPVSFSTTVSRALPTAASKIKGIGDPSSLRIENPAMCRSGFSPTPLGSPRLCIMLIPPGWGPAPSRRPPLPCLGPSCGPPIDPMPPVLMPSIANEPIRMLTPLNLTSRVWFGPRATRSRVGVVAPIWPKSSRWAIRASRCSGPLHAVSSHVDQIIQLEVDHGDDRRVRDSLGQAPLRLLNGVPALGISYR